jgi:lysozyme
MSTLFGIDTSYANGTIDWDKVAPHIDFAILQCGFGQDRTSQDDKQFKRAALACERLGIPYGIYLYGYAKNQAMADGEAKHVIRLAKGRQLSLPVYYDIEEAKLGDVAASNMRAFGKAIENAGYWCGVYSGEYYYNAHLKNVSAYTKWIARYNSNNGKQGTKPNVPNVAIWQYSSRGKVAGVSGYVDVNIAYVDLIKSVTGKDYIQAARDVWAGKYGTDPERSAKLKAEGFDPRIVQHFVNRLAR